MAHGDTQRRGGELGPASTLLDAQVEEADAAAVAAQEVINADVEARLAVEEAATVDFEARIAALE